MTVGVDGKGKQKRVTATRKSQKEALKELDKFREQKRKNSLVTTSACKVSEFIDRWLSIKEGQTKRTTYESYVDTCELHIKPALGGYRVQRLNTPLLNSYLAEKRKQGLSAASVSRHRAILHGILDLAVNEGIASYNVAEKCAAIKTERKETKTLTPEEIKWLLEVARGAYEKDKGKGNKFFQIYHIVLLALSTGARRGEVLALKWENVDVEQKKVLIKENLVEVKGGLKVETPKTKASRRVVAVDEDTISRLQELRRDSEWVFCTRDAKPLSPSNVGRAFRKLVSDAGLDGLRFHDLRHTHATLLVSHGHNLKTVSARLGHNSIQITGNLYSHALPEQDREAAERMGSWLSK